VVNLTDWTLFGRKHTCLYEIPQLTGTGELVRIEGKMNGTKYREILGENLLQSDSSPSIRITTLSTQPRQCRSGFGTSL
jgi:hypothetical protein